MIGVNKAGQIPVRTHGTILLGDFIGHVIEISIIFIVVGVGDFKSTTAYPPTQTSVISTMHQYNRRIWPGFLQESYVMHEHVAFDYSYACATERSIKFGFAMIFAVLIQLMKPRTKFHTRIKIATHVHGLASIGSWMGVASLGAVIRSIYAVAVIDILGYRAPFRTRCSGYKDVFQLFLYLDVS